MRELSIFVFVDALGWQLVQTRGFMDDVLTVRRPLETVLGYSATCIPTILTGRMPREHGHFSFFYRPGQSGDEGLRPAPASPFKKLDVLKWLPGAVVDRGRVRRVLSRALQSQLGMKGYFQLYSVPFDQLKWFDYSEKRDIYQPGGINGGCPTIFDRLREQGVLHHMSDWRRPEDENVESLQNAIEEGHISFAWLYLASLDGRLHAEGTGTATVTQHLGDYEEKLRRLLAAARRRYGKVSLTVFSDHGMTDITETYDVISRIGALGLTQGRDYVAMYDSTMVRFWFGTERGEQRVRDLLTNDDKGRILDGDDLHAFGCDFDDDRYGQLIFLIKPGVLVCPSFMGRSPMKGMHGYDPHDPASTASFLSTENAAPRRLDDLHDIMLEAARRATRKAVA